MKLSEMSARTCLGCGRVHMGVTRAFAESAVERFNQAYLGLEPKVQSQFAGPSSLEDYLSCSRCGGPHTNFRAAKEGDCPMAVTLGPILVEL